MGSEQQPGSARKDLAPAVTRALGVLGILEEADGAARSLSDIARELGIPKSSCVNICLALEQGRMIRKAADGYLLGMRTAELGGAYVGQFNQVREFFEVVAASPTLRDEVVQLVMLDGEHALYLARHEGRAPYRFGTPLGSRLPAIFSASGNALLASLDERERSSLVDALLPAVSPVGGGDLTREVLEERLAQARERGYAVDRGWSTPGVGGVAVPLSAWNPGDPPMAMGVAIQLDALSEERIAHVGTALQDMAALLENPWKAAASR
ncbi:MAG: IclR family transcriptional regulator [Dermabacter sp.]|nr:IclR family transcriptional regulator [Dermabacter sp.]